MASKLSVSLCMRNMVLHRKISIPGGPLWAETWTSPVSVAYLWSTALRLAVSILRGNSTLHTQCLQLVLNSHRSSVCLYMLSASLPNTSNVNTITTFPDPPFLSRWYKDGWMNLANFAILCVTTQSVSSLDLTPTDIMVYGWVHHSSVVLTGVARHVANNRFIFYYISS